ncbi:hypothetical protein [Actinocorallia longicatena]|uniref:Secreted protein n=1 Tax=Actinocorallia longicatena TaxID=111803 RepID=A0ABP6QFP1_9ACTN
MFSALLLAASAALSPAAVPLPAAPPPPCARHLWIRTFDGWACPPPRTPLHRCPPAGVLIPSFAAGTHCGLHRP